MSLAQRIALTKLNAWSAARPTFRSGPLEVPASSEVAPLIYRTPDWKTDLINQVLKVRNGAFVDVGVNIGQTLVDYAEAERQGGYVGFEPNSRCVDLATDIIRRNGLRNAVVIPAGLSHANTVVPFYVHPGQSTDSMGTMLRDIRPADPAETIFVPVYAFDGIYADVLGRPPLALVKIDVEGGEADVLRGMQHALATAKPWIICEVLHRDGHASAEGHASRCRALMSFIREQGYGAYLIQKTPDDKRVTGLRAVDRFPEVVYGPENKHECDYLFAPAGDDVTLPGITAAR